MRAFAFLLPVLLACSSFQPASFEDVRAKSNLELTAPFNEGEHTRDFELEVPTTGRYRCEIDLSAPEGTLIWVEAYPGNEDDRTYDITGPIHAPAMGTQPGTVIRDGSPLQAGKLPMRLHVAGKGCEVTDVRFTLLREHVVTPKVLEQNTEGDEWVLAWSDEFDGKGLPDPSKWTHDLGNWGWGNRELQYYTEGSTDNARQVDGRLIIEAHPDAKGPGWTSARLTTRGKVSFLYGRIEIRAKVPSTQGIWAAGWTLGDAYRDEISWPYCGEIDICEAVGREIEDATGNGINHGSCHTRAFYFKQGNHISNTIPVEKMSTEFHDYVCEWDKGEVRMYVDDVHYYTYDKTANELEWPFASPQCLILNLAIGGGMGGAVKEGAGPQRFEIEHVRVYEKK